MRAGARAGHAGRLAAGVDQLCFARVGL